MSKEHLYIMLVLLALASGIILLNDKLKHKSKTPKPAKRKNYGWKTLVAVFSLIILLFFIDRIFGNKAPDIFKWSFISFISIIIIAVLFLNRTSLWYLLKLLCSGTLPRFVHKDAEGNITIKCPNCSSVAPFDPATNRFICKSCGESSKLIPK